jgi:hypothetical protein
VQKICASECLRALGIGERRTQARQLIAQDISCRTTVDFAGECGRIIQIRDRSVLRVRNDERSSTLRNTIRQSHPQKLAAPQTGEITLG